MAGKKKTERTKIWLLGGEKGGMGKSMVGRVCAEQLLAAKVPFHLVDADASTPNVGLTYAKELYTGFRERVAAAPTLAAGNSPSTATLDRQIVFSGDASTYLQADRILTLAEQQDVLVVLPSQVAGYVKRWLDDNDVVGMLAEPSNTIDVVHFFVSNGTNESIELFKDSVESSKGKIPHVLVLNRGAATDIDWRWFDWDELVAKYLASYGFESIVIPELLLDPAVKTKILDGNIQFGDALKAEWMPKPSVRRLNKWLKEATQALASTKYFDCHPNYSFEVEATVESTGEKAAA
ncbi:cobalamin biosynthesis protein CobQ [Chamaesiphon polymorphus]|uniref:Cobalamin biosynthesis protein CobQ n=1 Tax=Chamaesiphon polymorphus CCALA 037 TaxID=2107692 RepID=A0A2T1G7S4_9CYAN|nr:cobalamin biosynthesis protein CobQ [Chamaesiphon polymorphus]PSB53284.1 cobalamin biosynthesis protein CobQ [Chamaesiphon polymorphus CCALA 037]